MFFLVKRTLDNEINDLDHPKKSGKKEKEMETTLYIKEQYLIKLESRDQGQWWPKYIGENNLCKRKKKLTNKQTNKKRQRQTEAT